MIRRIVTIALFGALLGGCSMDSFLFNTLPLESYELSSAVIPEAHRQEVTLRSGQETLYGFFVRQPDSLRIEPHPTVLYHHGNKHHLQHYWDRVELLYRAGFDVFIYDYRGFGKSSGSSSEDGLRADAAAALNYLRTRADVDTTQIVDYGYSLGGFPCLYTATTLHRPKAVITESIFASAEDLIQSGTLLDIPGGYLMEGAYDNAAQIGNVKAPLLMLHGTADTFIGIERHGEPLFALAPTPKIFRRIEGAGHDNIPATMGNDFYIELINTFVRGR
ncbi:MAG: alpha/beta fold hydrolase [Candidatus Kapabacteria bacterium]|nr:alpha/beta fold hydrolase [Candidatus Kapabacteria bacterium]